MSTSDKPAVPRRTRAHDPQATMKLITDAALKLLCEKGFPALGVNAVANAAGVDKQLIYYHFGGLNGVVRHLGVDLANWLGEPLQVRLGEPYAQAAQRLLMDYVAALRKNTLVLRLLAWEVVEPSATLSELEKTRSAVMGHWVAGLRASAAPPPEGVDAPAINAVLLAALNYLALREQSVGTFAGVDVQSDAGKERIANAVAHITRSVYAVAPTPATPSAAPATKPPAPARRLLNRFL